MDSFVPAIICCFVLFGPLRLLILLTHLLEKLQTISLLLQSLFPSKNPHFVLVGGEGGRVIVAYAFFADKQY